MSIKRQIAFILDTDDETDPRSKWKLSLSREGERLILGLHWDEKPYPTHTFSATFSEIENALKDLA